MKKVKGTCAELLTKKHKAEMKLENSPKQKRTRRFCLTSYIDPESLRRYIQRSPWVQHFALCTHDRDIQADGTLKELHTHVILYTYDAHTSSGIRKKFDQYSKEYYKGKDIEPQNTLCQDCHSVESQYRYLRHLDDPDKVQYENSEVFTDNDSYWKELCRTNGMNDSSVNTGLQMFDDMLDHVSTREMIVRYGKEYIYHARSFKEVITDHYKESPRGCDEDWLSFLEYRQLAGDYLSESHMFKDSDVNMFFNILDYLNSQFQLDLNISTNGRSRK